MTSLQETLPILDKAVPELPAKVAEAAKGAEQFEAAIKDLLENIEEKEGQARELLARTRAALAAIEQTATEGRDAVDEATSAVETAIEEALDAVATGRDEVRDALETTAGAMEDLSSQLVDAGSRTESAQEDAAGAVKDLGERMRSGQGDLDEAVGDVEAAADALKGALAEGAEAVSEAVAELSGKMTTLLEDATGRLGDAQSRLQQMRSSHEPNVEEGLSDMTSRKDGIFQRLQERVQEELRAALDDALGEITSALGELGDVVLQVQESCHTGREALQEQIVQLEERIPPLQGGVEQVKQAAAQVGVDWP